MCAPGEGPGRARRGTGGPRAPGGGRSRAVGAVAGRGLERRGVQMCCPGPPGPAWAHPSPSPLCPGPGGQVCTGQPRAPSPPSSGRGPGRDGAGTELAEPAQPARPSPARSQHKGKLGRGRSAAGWGPGRPAHRGASRSWGVMERHSLPHGHRQVIPVPLRGRGGGRDKPSLRPEGDCKN